jgi:hypothetical protein
LFWFFRLFRGDFWKLPEVFESDTESYFHLAVE